MSLTRIGAAARVGAATRPDLMKLVLCCELNGDGSIVAGDWPGVYEAEKRRWPFVLRTEGERHVLDYGSSIEEKEETNLPTKVVRAGELFTLVTCGSPVAFQVASCHRHVAGAVRWAKVTCECQDGRHPPGSRLVLFCGLEADNRPSEGEWLGYSVVEGIYDPFVFTPPKMYLDYGTDWPDWRERVDVTQLKPGRAFNLHSFDDRHRPDLWRFTISGVETLLPTQPATA